MKLYLKLNSIALLFCTLGTTISIQNVHAEIINPLRQTSSLSTKQSSAGSQNTTAYSTSKRNTTTSATASTPNKLGINIAAPLDYEEDRLYADVIRSSRSFILGTNENGTTLAPVDGDGWPLADFSFYVWASLAHRDGTYTLTFTGQATVTSNPSLPINVTYNSSTNTSSATINFTDTSSSSFLALRFANSRRTASSAPGSGVTAIKLMRPLSPGSAQSYPPTTLFNDPIKSLISKFSVIRFMDFLATNSNQQTYWSERPLPSWASFNRYSSTTSPTSTNKYGWQGIGGPWEHLVMLANETGKDAWINIPVLVDDQYIKNVANLIAYGSDGVNPYTSKQSNPVYPPLNDNLKLYVEYSNELWNSGSAFSQFYSNCQAASDELVSTNGQTPLNWDGIWNHVPYVLNGDNSTWNWSMCWRRPAKRSVEISNIFRSTFGDAAMGSRVRPVMMTQLGNPGAMLYDETKMMLNYYNNMAGNFVATPHPPSYYLYGAGGSGYYNPATTVSTLDEFFADPGFTPAGFAPALIADANYVTALGLKRVAYEGGPSLDKTGGARDAVSPLAIDDSRMKAAIVNMHNEWSRDSGDLLVYYRATGDYQWGFTSDIYNLYKQKITGIDSLNVSPRAETTYGTAIPATVPGGNTNACSRGWGCTMQSWDYFSADGASVIWASYSFRSSVAAPWTVTLATYNASSTATAAIYIDGVLVGTQSATGGTEIFNSGTISAGLHSVILRAASGAFSLTSINVK